MLFPDDAGLPEYFGQDKGQYRKDQKNSGAYDREDRAVHSLLDDEQRRQQEEINA